MSRYIAYPVVKQHGSCNVADDVIARIYSMVESAGVIEKVWFEGTVYDLDSFSRWFKNPNIYQTLVVDTQNLNICFLAWLTHCQEGTAQGHFCSLGRYRRGMAECALDFWRKLRQPDGEPFFRVIIGITPQENTQALRLVRLLGFTELSPSIPKICKDFYSGVQMPGVVSFCELN